MAKTLEDLFKGNKRDDSVWNKRTVDTISDAVLELLAENKNTCGNKACYMPRTIMFAREFERNSQFREAVKTVAETTLRLFPNNPDIADEAKEN